MALTSLAFPVPDQVIGAYVQLPGYNLPGAAYYRISSNQPLTGGVDIA